MTKTGGVKYDDVDSRSMRSVFRGGTLSIMNFINRANLGKSKPRVQFVYAHHVFRDEEDNFRRAIELLCESFKMVSYSEAVDCILEGEIEEPLLSISFDDGLKNCLRAGRILAEYGVSACFFVCPGVIGCNDPQDLKAFTDRLSLPPVSVLSWEDIEELQSLGHEIGGHTYTHRDLGELARARMKEEITQTYEDLKGVVSPPIHFAWPYGRFENFSEEAAETVFNAGFASCASAVRGCHSTVHDESRAKLCLRRDHYVAGRPIRNLKVFLTLNALLPWRQKNAWPAGWNVAPNR